MKSFKYIVARYNNLEIELNLTYLRINKTIFPRKVFAIVKLYEHSIFLLKPSLNIVIPKVLESTLNTTKIKNQKFFLGI